MTGPCEFDEQAFAIAELCEVVDALTDLAHYSFPQDEMDALLNRAEDALRRYRPAS